MTAAAHKLDSLFHPASVAIIGASSQETHDGDGWVARLLSFGFKGAIYPINLKAKEILGIKAYPSLQAVPEPVDYAILNIPAQSAPEVIQECGNKGVKLAHVYSAGFSEMGEEGAALQGELVRQAKEGGVRLLGPNSLGLYYPAVGLTFDRNFPKSTGDIAFASQSGSCAMRVVRRGALRGLRFSKVISYGNAADLNEKDFAEYLAQDKESRTLAFYLEGVRDEEGFIEEIKAAARSKPVVILEGGITPGGRRSAIAHTACGFSPMWSAFGEVPGLAVVQSLEELVDCLVAFQFLSKPFGKRVAILGRGAGLGVKAADAFEKEGFLVPRLGASAREQLRGIASGAGAMVDNPIEPPGPLPVWATFYDQALPVLDGAREVDLVLLNLTLDIHAGQGMDIQGHLSEVAAVLMDRVPRMRKPVAAVLDLGDNIEIVRGVWELREVLAGLNMPLFLSAESAARGLGHALRRFTQRGEHVSA